MSKRVFCQLADLAIGVTKAVTITAGVLLALPALAAPADDAVDDILVTDPAVLERLGFEADATNVYATRQAFEQLLTEPTDRASAGEEPLTDPVAPFGTETPGYTSIDASRFLPRSSSQQYAALTGPDGGRYCVSGGPFYTGIFESLPHGAKLEHVRMWYYDFSSENFEAFLFRVCQPPSSGPRQFTLLSTLISSGFPGPGQSSNFIDGPATVDQRLCVYQLEIRFGPEGSNNCSTGEDLLIQKAQLEWRRQVSPPPSTATFDDVPTTHPFFQHVEALVASGITSGCGGDSFCPGAPLTRGQMAAFLAKALGLHWDPESF